MKLDYIKDNKALISVILSGISVLFAVLICMKIISHFKLSARTQNIEDMVQTILDKDKSKSEDLDKYLCLTKEMANSLKKNNLFAPPQPKRNPVTEVQCILGDEAFINNKWYKEGEMVQDAKILTIEPMKVTIEWDGKKSVLGPLDAKMASAEPSERAPSRPGNIPAAASPRMVMVEPPSQGQPPDEPVSPSMVMIESPSRVPSPEEMEKIMMERMQNMSGEQQEKIQMMKMQLEKIQEINRKNQ